MKYMLIKKADMALLTKDVVIESEEKYNTIFNYACQLMKEYSDYIIYFNQIYCYGYVYTYWNIYIPNKKDNMNIRNRLKIKGYDTFRDNVIIYKVKDFNKYMKKYNSILKITDKKDFIKTDWALFHINKMIFFIHGIFNVVRVVCMKNIDNKFYVICDITEENFEELSNLLYLELLRQDINISQNMFKEELNAYITLCGLKIS